MDTVYCLGIGQLSIPQGNKYRPKRQCSAAGKVTGGLAGVALAMRYRHCGISIYGLNGLKKADEHPAFTPLKTMAPAPFTFLKFCRGHDGIVHDGSAHCVVWICFSWTGTNDSQRILLSVSIHGLTPGEYQWTVHVRRRCGLFVKLLWPLVILLQQWSLVDEQRGLTAAFSWFCRSAICRCFSLSSFASASFLTPASEPEQSVKIYEVNRRQHHWAQAAAPASNSSFKKLQNWQEKTLWNLQTMNITPCHVVSM